MVGEWVEYYDLLKEASVLVRAGVAAVLLLGAAGLMLRSIKWRAEAAVATDLSDPPPIPNWVRRRFARRLLWGIMLALAVAISIGLVDYWPLRKALVEGKYQVVEGTVDEFVAAPRRGNESEHFTVNGVRFAYYGHSANAGFHTTRPQGGPIEVGKRVRIYYHRGRILRLWIEEP